MVFPVQTRMFARLNFFKVTLRSMWEDYSDFISNFRDDLEEPYILPDSSRFDKMCRTGSLGDYLGLPTFGTKISQTVSLIDKPCAANSRAVSDTPLSESMKDVRAGRSITGQTCASSLNTNGKQTIVFTTAGSATAIPQTAFHIGVFASLPVSSFALSVIQPVTHPYSFASWLVVPFVIIETSLAVPFEQFAH